MMLISPSECNKSQSKKPEILQNNPIYVRQIILVTYAIFFGTIYILKTGIFFKYSLNIYRNFIGTKILITGSRNIITEWSANTNEITYRHMLKKNK